MRKTFIFISTLILLQTSFGCGGGPESSSPGGISLDEVDGQLTGKWYAEKPDTSGQTTILSFEPSESTGRGITIQAVRRSGDSITVDQGTYSVEGSHLKFVLPKLGNLDMPFAIETADHNQKLTLDGEIYIKGGSGDRALTGQVQVVQLSSDEMVTTSSSAPSITGNNLLPPLNDPLLESQQWYMQQLNMDGVFGDQSRLSAAQEVIVAVIDTGIRIDHPDLAGKILMKPDGVTIWGKDFVSRTVTDEHGNTVKDEHGNEINFSLDGDGDDDDPTDPGDGEDDLQIPGTGSSWHGTHLAGIIAATQNNGIGIAGINNHAKIMPLRAVGYHGKAIVPDVTEAIRWACKLENRSECTQSSRTTYTSCHIDNSRPLPAVINLSLGVAMNHDEAEPMLLAIHGCWQRGVLVVAAAGNNRRGPGYCVAADGVTFTQNPNCKFYPGADPNVLSVASITASGAFAKSYSNYGEHWVVAPGGSGGQGIWSTVNPGVGEGGYWGLTGTSQSTAIVSGLASLLKSYNTNLTPGDLINIISSTAIYLGDTPPYDDHFGYGLINPRAALLTALHQTPVGSPTLSVSVDTLHFGASGEKGLALLYNSGGGAMALQNWESRTDDHGNWLSVQKRDLTDPTGTTPTALVIKVDRTGMAEGHYHGLVAVHTNGGDRSVEVFMDVNTAGTAKKDEIDDLIKRANNLVNGNGAFENTVDVGEMGVIAVNVETGAFCLTKTNFSANYNFAFTNLDAGKYHVLVCKNDDGNQTYCDDAESIHLGFPTYTQPQTIDCTTACSPNSLTINY